MLVLRVDPKRCREEEREEESFFLVVYTTCHPCGCVKTLMCVVMVADPNLGLLFGLAFNAYTATHGVIRDIAVFMASDCWRVLTCTKCTTRCRATGWRQTASPGPARGRNKAPAGFSAESSEVFLRGRREPPG